MTLAAMGNHPKLIRWLAEHGANLEEEHDLGWPPIHFAEEREAIDALLVPREIRIAPCWVESDGSHLTFVLDRVRKADVHDAFALLPSPKAG